MPDGGEANRQTDPFMAAWAQFAKGGSWPSGGATAGSEVMDQMRQMFLDSMAAHADQFMRSEAFLGAMKRTVDNSLAWQQALNETLQRTLSAAQLPTKSDADHLVALVRGLEDRLVEKLDDLSQRVRRLEVGSRPESGETGQEIDHVDRSH